MSAFFSRRARLIAALLVAGTAVAASLPGRLAPWGAMVQRLTGHAHWPLLSTLVSLSLLLAAWLWPAPPSEAGSRTGRPTGGGIGLGAGPGTGASRRFEPTAMAVGLLLLCEPLVHLLVLSWDAWRGSPAALDMVLPAHAHTVFGNVDTAPVFILVLTLLVPVCEEAFFRGRLLIWLDALWQGRRWGRSAAVLITTLTFAAAHGDAVQALIAVPLGILLAIVRLRSGTLAGCILAHACHNSLFLFAGPALIGAPNIAPLLACGGVLLLEVACWPSALPLRSWRATAILAGSFAAIWLTTPLYQHAQDQLWVRAVHRLVIAGPVANEALIVRLDESRRHGRLAPQRSDELYQLLLAQPCPPSLMIGRMPRQTLILADLDPLRFAKEVPADDRFARLLDLSDTEADHPRIDVAARALGRRAPADFAEVVSMDPECLRHVLPLPAEQDDCLAQIMSTTGHPRRKLLAAVEHAFPGRLAPILLALPAACVTPIDRRHLFGNYPAALELIAGLDESKRAAWLGGR